MGPIHFEAADIPFQLPHPHRFREWFKRIIIAEQHQPGEITVIFCSDHFLHQLNQNYLQHDTYTDILTFDLSDHSGEISGEIYVSIDRVKENAGQFQVAFEDELSRVMIHGVLHLIGYDDRNPGKKKEMREKEDDALKLLTLN